MQRHYLHGPWQREIGGRQVDYVTVPGSYRPVGACTLGYDFASDWADAGDDTLFLVTEGVMAGASFTLNGQPVGEAGPWAPYRFPLPAGLLRADNTLTAEVRDIQEEFGTTPGRRYEAGLFRDIYLERRPAIQITNVAFRAVLNDACTAAEVTVQVENAGEGAGDVTAVLTERDGYRVATAVAPAGSPLTFSVLRPHLWSPATPCLYTLTVTLGADTVTETVGFRRLEVRGRDFYLNNTRLVLKGVCRHEFTSRHGYTPTEEEIRRELALIKHAGFNYVRLVHSPQSPLVPRLAAEIGLLVTEEPGTCWHNLDLPAVAARARETLRRVVLRDRNLPSILAWYLYNECPPSIPYARDAAAMCRELDPGCLVSTADSSGDDTLLRAMADAASFDFYGINQYSGAQDYVERAKGFPDKPLVFTEWGGWLGQGNARALQLYADTFARHVQPDAEPRMAGCTFWAWADYEEFSRGLPSSPDGWTVEGLLDKDGNPKPDLQTLSLMCFAMDHPAPVYAPPVEVLLRQPRRLEAWHPVPLDMEADGQSALKEAVARMRARFTFRNPAVGAALVAGIPFLPRETDGLAPLLLGAGCDEVVIPVNREVRAVAVLGHVALRGGYPNNAVWSVYHPDQEAVTPFGAPAAAYTFVFEDGEEEIPLAHGIHVLRANDICRWWLTDPRAPETAPALRTVLHPTYESLRFDLWEHAFPTPRRLKEIRWRLADPGAILALLAVSVETCPTL